MKVARLEAFGVAVPLLGKRVIAYSTHSVQKSVVVRITTDDGEVGLGNVDPVGGYSKESADQTLSAVRDTLGPRIMGMDPSNIHLLLQRLDSVAQGFLDAKAAIEMACVDLGARRAGMPVHRYLGGAVKDELRFNAWIGIVPPEQAAQQAVAWRDRGFRSAKVKVGNGIEADRDRIRAVRQAVGPDFQIRIDANAGYDAATSIRLARMVAPFDLQLFEQPVPADDIAGMARVRRESAGIPVMADESLLDHRSLIRIIRADAADIVKVKVMKQGGIFAARAIIATAESAGLRCVVGHGFGLGVNTNAELMLAATSACVLDGLECVGPLNIADDIVTHSQDMRDGRVPLPDGPGLGVTLDMDKIERYRYA